MIARRSDEAPVTAYDRIAATIRAQILSGELAPGDRLPTGPDLCAQFEVSLNTARGALVALAGQGLVTLKRGVAGGAFVAVPSTEHVSGLLQTSLTLLADNEHVPIPALTEIREVLEVPAAELAALRHTDDEITAIRATLFDPRRVDPATIYSASQEFHAAVLRAAHNPLFELVAEPIFRVLENRFVRTHWPLRVWREVDREHREILGYLQARDQAGAREATRYHLRSITRTYGRVEHE